MAKCFLYICSLSMNDIKIAEISPRDHHEGQKPWIKRNEVHQAYAALKPCSRSMYRMTNRSFQRSRAYRRLISEYLAAHSCGVGTCCGLAGASAEIPSG